jgi:MFS family permease
VLAPAVACYVAFVYASFYLTDQMHHLTSQAVDISPLALIVRVLVSLAGGFVADRMGRRPAMFLVTIARFLLTWPLRSALNQETLGWILFAQVISHESTGWARA